MCVISIGGIAMRAVLGTNGQAANHAEIFVSRCRANNVVNARLDWSGHCFAGGLARVGMHMCFHTIPDLPHVHGVPLVHEFDMKFFSGFRSDIGWFESEIGGNHANGAGIWWLRFLGCRVTVNFA